MTAASTFNAIDLSQLTAPDIIEALDFDTIYADNLATLKGYITDFDDSIESDPAVRLLQIFSYRELLLRQRVNDTARALSVAYAVKSDLDHIGVTYYQTQRLVITPANSETGAEAVMETDTDYRTRMLLAPEGYSVAGPSGAYVYHALSADSDVADASAISPNPAEVLVTVLSRSNNGTAGAPLLAKVNTALNATTVRPLTDEVTVQAANIVEYHVTAEVTTYSGPDSSLVIAAGQAAAQKLADNLHKLGKNVTRAAFIAAIHQAGAENTVLTSPAADIEISDVQASRCTGITITHAGVAD